MFNISRSRALILAAFVAQRPALTPVTIANFTTLVHQESKRLCDLITPPSRLKLQRHWPG